MAESSTIILCKKARVAAEDVAALTTEQKNDALGLIADSLEAHMADILAANDEDIAAATGNIPDVMLDRLKLNEERVRGMADGIRALIDLPDPVGKVVREYQHPAGMLIQQVHAPLGVVAIIYESRPNVTSDAFALAFKSGNACVLRGGKESYRSSFAVVTAMKEALRKCCINEDAVGLVSDLTHDSANELMTAVGLVDLLIPRGGAGLIRRITENAKVPCIQTGSGICHVYVDNCADLPKAVNIVNNAKTQRPSVCNAEEVLLVHKDRCVSSTSAKKRARCPSNSVSAREPRPSSPAHPPAPWTSTPSTTTTSSPSKSWTASMRPSATSESTPPATAKPSSPARSATRNSSSIASTARPSMSTSPPASPTAESSASAARWASPPRNSTPADLWVSRN